MWLRKDLLEEMIFLKKITEAIRNNNKDKDSHKNYL